MINDTKLYDVIRELLRVEPELRDSDKKLTWRIAKRLHLVSAQSNPLFGNIEFITYESFMSPKFNLETIRRTRQKVVQDHPEYGPSPKVKALRENKQKKGKYFVYHERV